LVELCHEPPVAESQGNERDEAQWKIWMTRKFSTASSACSFHGTARALATSNGENLSPRYHGVEARQVNFLLRVSGNPGFSFSISLGA
jgi:hypothetical protein